MIASIAEKLTFNDRGVLVFIELKQDENEGVIFDGVNSIGVKLTISSIVKNDLFERNASLTPTPRWLA